MAKADSNTESGRKADLPPPLSPPHIANERFLNKSALACVKLRNSPLGPRPTTPSHPMRTLRLCAIITLGLALGYLVSDAAEAKRAKCCDKAAKAGHACDHACCIEAAKAGKNCEKCGGKN